MRRITRRTETVATVSVLALLGLPLAPSTAAHRDDATRSIGSTTAPASSPRATPTRVGGGDAVPNYDVRQNGSRAVVRETGHALRTTGPAARTLARRIGGDARVALDPISGSVAQVSSRTGFLTPASRRPAAEVALGFVRSHLGALGLATGDISTLIKQRQYTDINGITHVFWGQQVAGIPVFGNGLRANVDRAGRLISVLGSPVSGLPALAAAAPDSRVSERDALGAAVRDVRGEPRSGRAGGTASRVWFLAPDGLRPGWVTYTRPSSDEAYSHVIDAATGRALYRRSTVSHDRGDVYVFDNYPGARGTQSGGTRHVVNFSKRGWLKKGAKVLKGKYAYVFADVNDDNVAQKSERGKAPRGKRPQFAFTPFKTARSQQKCTKDYVCTYNPNKPFSWRTNKNADATQAFYYLSRYADWLAKAPFGFTRTAGNFTQDDGDLVLVNTLDGANTDHGLPDGAHVNNANFDTPPDGQKPTLQLYLNRDDYLAASSSFPFDTIGHEFVHGLSNRLVVDSSGYSTLNSYQAGAMGEAWSDLYAIDFQLAHHLIKKDTAKAGELMYDRYLSRNRAYTRTEAIDCPVGKDARLCKQIDGVGVGGYTYGDIPGQLSTEVHSAGEVWSQTLWDLHRKLGHAVTMRLVTAAMTLSPDDPSMLDERDAILTADKAIYGRAHTSTIWKTFAHRGMGYYAASLDGSDPQPIEDFHLPPSPSLEPGTISGQVTDPDGNPLGGAVVTVAGHNSSPAGTYSAVTNPAGLYTINGVAPGTYPKVVAYAGGYDSDFSTAHVTAGGTTPLDFTLRRDWAAAPGGATIASSTGPDFTDYGCGPAQAIDQSQGTGWGSAVTDDESPVTSPSAVQPRSIVVALPQSVDVDGFAVDPTATCGDGASASTADYTIEVGTSPSGPWTLATSGTFDTLDQGRMNSLSTATFPGVTYVRYTMVTPQVSDWAGCPDDYSGCTYMDTTELAVYGTAAP